MTRGDKKGGLLSGFSMPTTLAPVRHSLKSGRTVGDTPALRVSRASSYRPCASTQALILSYHWRECTILCAQGQLAIRFR